MNYKEEDEVKCAEMLNKNRFLVAPKICSCGNNHSMLQYDKNAKTSNCFFRCKNPKCKYRHAIRINSFYSLFSKMKLCVVSEIIKNFISGIYDKNCYEKIKKKIWYLYPL